ncbi:FAD-binding oxidoreductase [Nocardia sp. NPDC051570]|uniref:FAD-binding oxidoreductase n=1 Tax=Nocardia sp. NPDC051570 TaxID=3364324 RepID=UPI00379EFC7C
MSTAVSSTRNSTLETLEAVRAMIGADRVDMVTDNAGELVPLPPFADVSMSPPHTVLGVVRPRSAEDVQRIVALFDQSPSASGLYVYSTGHNWGFGSRGPAVDNVVALDLGNVDQLRGIDIESGWAIVEPGVTQATLATRLMGTSRVANLTSSSGHTSLVGNLSERGVGMRRHRVDDLLGLEVVLPDGHMVRLGWWPETGKHKALYQHGLGPNPLHLFLQSNLGIITAAVIRLMPRPPRERLVTLPFTRADLTAVATLVREWMVVGLVNGVPKFADATSVDHYGVAGVQQDQMVVMYVDGTAATIDTSVQLLLDEAAATGLFGDPIVVDEPEPGTVAAMMRAQYSGDPSYSEAIFENAYHATAETFDDNGPGWMFFATVVPFAGADMIAAYELIERIEQDTGVKFGAVFNIVDADSGDLVLNYIFDRTEEEAAKAHRGRDRAYELFAEAGYYPYRLDSGHGQLADKVSPGPEARELIARFKNWLDPHHTIAVGRYETPPANRH